MVVLPAPLGPSKAQIVPAATCRSMPSSTTWSPNALRKPRVSIIITHDTFPCYNAFDYAGK